MIRLCRLQDRVTVLNASAEDVLNWNYQIMNHRQGQMPTTRYLGLLFIDHIKANYLHDLQSILAHDLLQSGCVVVADNVLCFQSPLTDYLDFVRDTRGPFASSECYEYPIEYSKSGPGGAIEAGREEYYHDGVEVSLLK
mmetsp:Transcript_23063/g.31604  ORF Transcript_23063/g.31604 Transcript_23063/m.31604 type:complete len:139 (-) Transcript_23063:92-508(-)